MKAKDLPMFRDAKAKRIVQRICENHKIAPILLQELIDANREFAGSGRAEGINERFDTCFGDFELVSEE